MIDVVYKLGYNCEWGDFEELRYSLRSLEKNFKDLGKVYVVGYRPRWLHNIIHIHALDPYKTNKDGNLVNKLILASVHKEITPQFINISDDQYFLSPTTVEEMKYPIIDNSHIQFIPNAPLNRWQQRLKRTISVLKERGFTHDCYEAHTPYLIDSSNYMSTLMQYDYGVDLGYCGNTLYFNTLKKPGRVITKRDLARITSSFDYDILQSKLIGVKFLNHTNKGLNDSLKKILKEKFPEPSKFEIF